MFSSINANGAISISPIQFFLIFSKSTNHKVSRIKVLNIDLFFLQEGKKPNLSPASNVG